VHFAPARLHWSPKFGEASATKMFRLRHAAGLGREIVLQRHSARRATKFFRKPVQTSRLVFFSAGKTCRIGRPRIVVEEVSAKDAALVRIEQLRVDANLLSLCAAAFTESVRIRLYGRVPTKRARKLSGGAGLLPGRSAGLTAVFNDMIMSVAIRLAIRRTTRALVSRKLENRRSQDYPTGLRRA
jgi:hypothetical protein